MIPCPHEKIISKSEADFDTQWRRQMPRDLEGSVATLLPLPNRFVSTEGWRRYDFIIVGGKEMDSLCRHRPIGHSFIRKDGKYKCMYCGSTLIPERSSWRKINIIASFISVAVTFLVMFAIMSLPIRFFDRIWFRCLIGLASSVAVLTTKCVGMYFLSRHYLRYIAFPSTD